MADNENKANNEETRGEGTPTASYGSVGIGPGEQIGPYKLLRILGEGGYGIVYLAERHRPVKRRVALKVIKPGMDTKQVIARFEAERQALALLDHPNIAHVFNAGTTEAGRPYFAMEYVKGDPITEHCDRYKFTIEERLKLFITICEAVQYAHQKAIIHRDIKPSNILVAYEGEKAAPMIIDFGVAKALSQSLTERTLVTEQAQMVGTPEYMSPEQAEMTSQDIDTRTDVYSLGVLLYELLTGTLPFDSQTLREGGPERMRRMIREQDPKIPSVRFSTVERERSVNLADLRRTDVRTLERRLHGELDWITLKAMDKDRTRRYQTAHALAEDIQRYLNQEPVLAGPPSTAYKVHKFVIRNKSLVVSVATMVIILVLATVISISQMLKANQATKREENEKERALRAEVVAEKARKDAVQQQLHAEAQELAARQRAYASDMSLAAQALSTNNLGRARVLLNRCRPLVSDSGLTSSNDLRGWEWRYLWGQCHSDALLTLCQEPRKIWSLATSHDGRWLAVGMEDGGLSIRDLVTRNEIQRLVAGDGVVRVAFSPREQLLAFSVIADWESPTPQHSVRLWNNATEQIILEIPLGGECKGLAFSPDGQALITYSANPENEVSLWRIPAGTNLASCPVAKFDEMAGVRGTPFAAADDMSMVAVAPDDTIHLIDLPQAKVHWIEKAADESVKALALSPDGKTLASGAGFVESAIRLWDTNSGKEITRLQGHRAWVSSLVFWPDGKTLASASADQTIRLWDLTDIANVPPPRVLRGHELEVSQLALLPDSKTLVSGSKDGSVYVWDVTKIRHEETRVILPITVAAWRFAADSKSVLTVDVRGHLEQWKGTGFQTNELLMDFDMELRSLWFHSPVFISHEGRWAAAGSADGTIKLWDLQKRTLVHEHAVADGWVFPLEYTQNEDRLVVFHANDGSFHEWDLSAWRQTCSWRGFVERPVVAFSPDQRKCLVLGLGGKALLRDMVTGHETNQTLDIREADVASFSPNGRFFAVASSVGYARLWETATFREVFTFRGFLMGVHSVAFSPDGKRLAVGGDGKEAVKLWDMESYHELLTLEGKGSLFVSSAFSSDGNILGVMNAKGELHLWRAPSWKEIEKAEKVASDMAW